MWPKDIIDELFVNITEDGNGNKYGDANLYDSLGNKYLNDFDIEYYFEILIKGPGKNARLAVKKSDFELTEINTILNQYQLYRLVLIIIIPQYQLLLNKYQTQTQIV